MNGQLSDFGAFYIADTDDHTGLDVYGFLAITDTVIAAINYKGEFQGPSADEGAVITGVVLTKGMTIFLKLDEITLTSGSILAYRGS